MNARHSSSPPLLAVFLLSATALAYEVLLVRLFSIIHWHHFAFMVISIALLGYAVSGSFITLIRERLLLKFESVFIGNALLFGVSTIICFITVQHLPFNTLEVLWDSSQWQRLLFSYLILALPFFFVANAIALSMMRFDKHIALIYGVDLIGAGLGAVIIMLLLQHYSAETILKILAICGIAAGFFITENISRPFRIITSCILAFGLLLILLMPQQWLKLQISEYKGLQQSLLMKDASLLSHKSSSIAQTDVIQSPLIPFRHAPGLSLLSPAGPPEQLAVFRDGDEMNTIDHVTGKRSLEYHDYMSSALPYHLQASAQNALILSAATGAQILQARLHNIKKIDAVEPDRDLSELITLRFAQYFNWPALKDRVSIHNISARGYAASEKQYDLVILGPSGASAGGAAGVHALSTSYDLTVEALQSYLKLLTPKGLLSITLWSSNPARANLKLFATAVQAMRNSGIQQPEKNLAWIRSWNTATLVIKNSALTSAEMQTVRRFSSSRGFDLAWLPDISEQEVNQYQVLQEPVFFLTASSLLKDNDQRFIQDYKYLLQPSTDDRPYFNFYFKWSSLQELRSLPAQAGISLTGVGYPTLLLTLAQASIAAIFLILLPLLIVSMKNKKVTVTRSNIVVYFLAIGLAFLFIEIAFIQKFILILSQPLYAVAIALCAFLIFSGLGSLYVEYRLHNEPGLSRSTLLRRAVLFIGLITVFYVLMVPRISSTIMAQPESLRILTAFILAAPLAFFMGMPFALGLSSLQQTHAELIPWAWGINGCASVLSAILAVVLAIHIGFNGIMLSAVALYVIAWFSRLSSTG